ncbi:muscleblind [Carabus blaptoides fortunei]
MGRCNREKPPCKYFHPPQHLKDQLLINGRNHLALKNAIMQQMGLTPGQPLVPGQVPTVAANPYLTGMPQVGSTYSPYFAPGPIMPAIMGPDPSVASPLGVVPQTVVAQQKMPRSDRLEMDVKSVGSFYYENFAFPGMVPYKRPAADKSGMPVYQPSATTYQQLMQLQQPFVPVSCEYTSPPPPTAVTSLAMPPASASSPITTTILSAVPDPPTTTAHKLPTAVSQAAAAIVQHHQAQQQQQQAQLQVQEVDDVESARSLPTSSSAVSVAPPLPPPTVVSIPTAPVTPIPDPAALAKEVAQQNYAKAVKLAAVSNSLAINPLTALSYTGVALNKQTMSMPPPSAMPRYSTLPFNFGGAGLGLGIANPYAAQAQAQAQAQAAAAAAASQQNLYAFSRPPPTFINPYSALLRPYSPAGTSPLIGHHPQGLLSAAGQYHMAGAPTYTLAHHQAPVVSMPQTNNNNNNVVLQPYKKMKTT